jgi:hypothetical protein
MNKVTATIHVGASPLAFGIFIRPAPRFAGTPGQANCIDNIVSARAQQYCGLARAAAAARLLQRGGFADCDCRLLRRIAASAAYHPPWCTAHAQFWNPGLARSWAPSQRQPRSRRKAVSRRPLFHGRRQLPQPFSELAVGRLGRAARTAPNGAAAARHISTFWPPRFGAEAQYGLGQGRYHD